MPHPTPRQRLTHLPGQALRGGVGAVALLAVLACSSRASPSSDASRPVGSSQHEPFMVGPKLVGPAQRVVSLAPNTTEIVYALGAGSRLVADTRYCDFPPEAKALPKIGGFLDPSLEAILALKPDLVVGVPNGQNKPVIDRLGELGIAVLVAYGDDLDDARAAILAIGRALAVEPAAQALDARMTAQLDAVQKAVADAPRPKTLLLYGHKPIVVAGAGTYGDALLTIAGGTNAVVAGAVRYPTLSLETVVTYAPEVILDAYAAGMGSTTSGSETSDLAELTTVPAVKNRRLHSLSGNASLRPGPRAGDDARAIAKLLHPERFP